MATRISDYRPEITEPSRHELTSIARWLQQNSFTAYLVGGWAVYFHTKSSERPPGIIEKAKFEKSRMEDPFGFKVLGSKDIDLVFNNKAEKEEFEKNYCRNNGFVRRGLFPPKEWVKNAGGTDIILDFDLLARKWPVLDSIVEWRHLAGHSQEIWLGEGAEILVPSKELLLLYKCVALVERTANRHKQGQDLAHLDSKIWKDANDVLALYDTRINADKLGLLSKETKLEKIRSAAKKIIAANYESYGFAQYASAREFLKE